MKKTTALFFVSLVTALNFGAPAVACDTCDFFLKPTHRTGAYLLKLTIDRSAYTAGTMPVVKLTIVNHGSTVMHVSTHVPVWLQTAYHVEHVGVSGGSEFDKAIEERRGKVLLPGSSFSFTPASLTKWTVYYAARGTYHLAFSYRKVDSNLVTFTIK